MIAQLNPSSVKGTIESPSSKSMMQRICALALLHQGETIIHKPGFSEDDKGSIRVIESLGASVITEDGNIKIISQGTINPVSEINFGESGLSCRMFTPLLALSKQRIRLTGRGSLLRRDMSELINLLILHNVKVDASNSFLPIEIEGPLTIGNKTIDGSHSSQYITGLILAYAYMASSPIVLKVDHAVSKPYITLTLNCLNHFGYQVEHESYHSFLFNKKKPVAHKIEIAIEGDWSSASFLLVAGVIAGNLTITGLNTNSSQADVAILGILKAAKADIDIQTDFIKVRQTSRLNSFQFDATDAPDLFPILVCLAAFCTGNSVIKGVGRLINKESNRANSLLDVFGKLGVVLQIEDDVMTVCGPAVIQSCDVFSHQDHRIAMSAAIAALRANGPVTIHQSEVVSKSFPDFFKVLQSLGASVTLTY